MSAKFETIVCPLGHDTLRINGLPGTQPTHPVANNDFPKRPFNPLGIKAERKDYIRYKGLVDLVTYACFLPS